MAAYSQFWLNRISANVEVLWAPTVFNATWANPSSLALTSNTYGLPYKACASCSSTSLAETSGTNTTRCLVRVLIGPLTAQTISGNIDGIIGVGETNVDADMYWRWHWWVSQGQSNTARGVCLNAYEENTTNEWALGTSTTGTGAALQAPQALTPVTSVLGDYLIGELGYIARNATASSRTGRLFFGALKPLGGGIDAPAPDLTVGQVIDTGAGATMYAGFVTFTVPVSIYEPAPVTDDLVASNRDVYVYDGATGLKRRVFVSRAQEPAGAGQDSTGKFYLTDELTSKVFVFDTALDPLTMTELSVTPGILAHSISFNGADQFVVGFAGDGVGNTACGDFGTVTGTAASYAVRSYTAAGVPIASYAIAPDVSGSNALDLAADQRTLFYTSLGRKIKRYDLVSNIQLTDFVTLPTDGGMARGIRLLPDGGVIVADKIDLKQYDSSGTFVRSFSIAGQDDWGTVGITSDGLSVWAANTANVSFATPMIAKFDIATGAVLVTITTDVPDTGGYLCSGGITVWNGFRAATSGGDTPQPERPPFVAPSYFERQSIIRRLRQAPYISQENIRIFHSEFELDLEAGLGLATGQGEDPTIMIRWSDDRGHTWSNEHWVSAGRMGEYATRPRIRRLGQSRFRVYQVVVTDPTQWRLVNAYLSLEPGTN